MAASTVPGFLESSIVSPGTAAMMLALTQTIYDEDLAKKLVAKKGLKAVVTEVGEKPFLMISMIELTGLLLGLV